MYLSNYPVDSFVDVSQHIGMKKGTLLHEAARKGDLATIQYLINTKAQLEAKDWLGRTPLHAAAEADQSDAISALLSHGAKLDAIDDEKNTPLHCAVEFEHLEATLTLIKGGADLFSKNDSGFSALELVKNKKFAADLMQHMNLEKYPEEVQEMLLRNASGYLNWRDRPSELCEQILGAFNKLSKTDSSGWSLYNGQERYQMLGLDEFHLIEKLIREAPEDQKQFYFLDIGAGNFQWGKGLSKHLNAIQSIASDRIFHIVSIRGESAIENYTEGKCRLYNLGPFPIENLTSKIHAFIPAQSLDFAISHYCFRHLCDPVGTFAQTFDLLRPQTGMLAIDGFYFNFSDRRNDYNWNMLKLISQTQAQFLVSLSSWNATDQYSLDCEFLLKKGHVSCAEIPFRYSSFLSNFLHHVCGAKTVTEFSYIEDLAKPRKIIPSKLKSRNLLGDRELFEWIKPSTDRQWDPLFEDQIRE